MIDQLPTETVQYILDLSQNINNFLLLHLTCHHFNNMILIPKFESNHDEKLPNFILTEYWAKLLHSKNTNFSLPEIYSLNDVSNLYPKLICNNSIFVMKMICQFRYGDWLNSIPINYTTFKNCFKTDEDYLIFCKNENLNLNNTSIIIFPLLILTYLFGTKEMLQLFLDFNMIEDMDFTTDYIADKKTNIMEFINKYDLKNNWEMKYSVYKKVKLTDLILYIEDFDPDFRCCNDIKIMLDKYCKSFYDMDKPIQFFDKNHITGLKIKHIILFMTKTYCDGDITLINFIINYFDWNNLDREVIDKINLTFNLDICLF
jgi:hypothetical protein